MKKIPPSRVETLSFPERLDVRIIEALRPWLEKPSTRRLGEIGNLGDEPPLLILSATLLGAGLLVRDYRLQRAGLRMGLAHLIAIAIKEIGKNSINRSRPSEQLDKGRYVMKPGESRSARLRSFPSGHTAGALAVARAFGRVFPRYEKPALLAAGVIGLLQVPRRAHFPGDVMAGGFAGLFAEQAADLLISRLMPLDRAARRRHAPRGGRARGRGHPSRHGRRRAMS